MRLPAMLKAARCILFGRASTSAADYEACWRKLSLLGVAKYIDEAFSRVSRYKLRRLYLCAIYRSCDRWQFVEGHEMASTEGTIS